MLEQRGVVVTDPAFADVTALLLFVAGVLTTVYFVHSHSEDEQSGPST